MSSDTTQPERVKYIPQNFLETLCTTEDDHEFEGELKKIIFQYLDPAQRFGLNDLDSIINYLTRENSASCSEIQSRIKVINTDIIEKEEMLAPAYKSKLANELKYKQEQLSNTQSAKPKEVVKPSLEDNPDAKKAKDDIERIQEICKQITISLQKMYEERETVIKAIQDISVSKDRLERFNSQLESVKRELQGLYAQNDLDIESVISISYHPEVVVSKVNELTKRLTAIDKQLDENNSKSLKWQYTSILKQLEDAKKMLSAPELEYQKYLKEKLDWEKMLEDIIGTPEKDGTIKNLQARIEYIEHQLAGDLSVKMNLRKQCVEDLMQKKHQVLDTYNSLFAPIVKFIRDYHEELKDHPIEFDSTFAIRNFEEKLFDYVSQQAVGSYYGKEQGLSRMKDNIDSVDMSDMQSIVDFACLINNDLLFDKRDGQNINRIVEAQLKKGHSKQELYDFIYGMDYVIPFFLIKTTGKV